MGIGGNTFDLFSCPLNLEQVDKIPYFCSRNRRKETLTSVLQFHAGQTQSLRKKFSTSKMPKAKSDAYRLHLFDREIRRDLLTSPRIAGSQCVAGSQCGRVPNTCFSCFRPNASELQPSSQESFLSVFLDPRFLPTSAAGAVIAASPWPATQPDPFHADWPHWLASATYPEVSWMSPGY